MTSESWRTGSGNTGGNTRQIPVRIAQWFRNGGRHINEVENKHAKNSLPGFLGRRGNGTQQRVFQPVNEQM